jgi:hypothetical protein
MEVFQDANLETNLNSICMIGPVASQLASVPPFKANDESIGSELIL